MFKRAVNEYTACINTYCKLRKRCKRYSYQFGNDIKFKRDFTPEDHYAKGKFAHWCKYFIPTEDTLFILNNCKDGRF